MVLLQKAKQEVEEREVEQQQMKEQKKEAAEKQEASKGQEQEQDLEDQEAVSLLVSLAGPRGVLSQATDLLLSWQHEDNTQQTVQIY